MTEMGDHCARFKVALCPDTVTTARNVVTLCPKDMEQWPSPSYVTVEKIVFLAEPHPDTELGTIGMNKIQRGSLSLRVGQEISLARHPVEMQEKMDQVTVRCKLVVELGHRRKDVHTSVHNAANANPNPDCLPQTRVATNTEFSDEAPPLMEKSPPPITGHNPPMSENPTIERSGWDMDRVQASLAALFVGHVWTKGQSIFWEYENKPRILTVWDIVLEDYGQTNVSAESGIFTSTTTVLFEH